MVKEYKDGYLPYELPLSIKYDDGAVKPLHISIDEENFIYYNAYIEETSLVSADFNGDGVDEALTIEVTRDFKESENNFSNHPIQIKMIIGDSVEEFKSTWNDGIKLLITDFNINDNYMDIFLFHSGTDIDGYFNIYRCDGRSISYYTGHTAQYSEFSFDGNGKIYFAEYLEGYYDENLENHKGQFIKVLNYDNLLYEAYEPEA